MVVWWMLSACAMNPEAAATPGPSRVATLPYYDARTFTPAWMQPDRVPDDYHRIPEFELLNQRGETVTEAAMDGKITVASFFFTSCGGICPKMTASLKRIDAELAGEDVLLLTHTVMPSTDTVAALRAYTARHDISSERWHFLTGERSMIYALGRRAYFAEEDLGEAAGDDDFLHSENLVLVDGDRHLRGVYNGLDESSVGLLLADVRTLLAAR